MHSSFTSIYLVTLFPFLLRQLAEGFWRGKRLSRGFFWVYFGVSSVYLCLCFLLQAAKIPRSIRSPLAKIPRLICELANVFFPFKCSQCFVLYDCEDAECREVQQQFCCGCETCSFCYISLDALYEIKGSCISTQWSLVEIDIESAQLDLSL